MLLLPLCCSPAPLHAQRRLHCRACAAAATHYCSDFSRTLSRLVADVDRCCPLLLLVLSAVLKPLPLPPRTLMPAPPLLLPPSMATALTHSHPPAHLLVHEFLSIFWALPPSARAVASLSFLAPHAAAPMIGSDTCVAGAAAAAVCARHREKNSEERRAGTRIMLLSLMRCASARALCCSSPIASGSAEESRAAATEQQLSGAQLVPVADAAPLVAQGCYSLAARLL